MTDFVNGLRANEPVAAGPTRLTSWFVVDSDPSGIVTKPAGTIAFLRDGTDCWLNVDGTPAGWISGMSLIPGAAVSARRTILDVDFAAEPSQSLATDGPKVIAGKTFTKINSASDSVPMALVTGQGVVIQPNNTCDYHAGTRTVPALVILPAALDPKLNLRSGLRIWLYVSADTIAANGYQNFEDNIVFCDSGNMDWSWDAVRGAINGPKLTLKRTINGVSVFAQTVMSAIDDSNRIIILDIPRIGGFEAAQLFGTALSGGWPFLRNIVAGNTSVDDLSVAAGRSDFYCPHIADLQVGFSSTNVTAPLPSSATIARLRIDAFDDDVLP